MINYPPEYQKFIKECEDAGFKIVQYQHKAIDKFPAIIVSSLDEIDNKLTVQTQYNKIGTAFIIFPK